MESAIKKLNISTQLCFNYVLLLAIIDTLFSKNLNLNGVDVKIFVLIKKPAKMRMKLKSCWLKVKQKNLMMVYFLTRLYNRQIKWQNVIFTG